jgi:hypothetical protein
MEKVVMVISKKICHYFTLYYPENERAGLEGCWLVKIQFQSSGRYADL